MNFGLEYEKLTAYSESEATYFENKQYLEAAVQVRYFLETILDMYSEKFDFSQCITADDKLKVMRDSISTDFADALYNLKRVGNAGAHADEKALSEYKSHHELFRSSMRTVLNNAENDFSVFLSEIKKGLKAVLAEYKIEDMRLVGDLNSLNHYEMIDENIVRWQTAGFFSTGLFSKEPVTIYTEYETKSKELRFIKAFYEGYNLFKYSSEGVEGLWTEESEPKKEFLSFIKETSGRRDLSDTYYYAKVMNANSDIKGIYLSVDIYANENMPFMWNGKHYIFTDGKICSDKSVTGEIEEDNTNSEFAEQRKKELGEYKRVLDYSVQMVYLLDKNRERYRCLSNVEFVKEIDDYCLIEDVSDITKKQKLFLALIQIGNLYQFAFMDEERHIIERCNPIVTSRCAFYTIVSCKQKRRKYVDKYGNVYPVFDFYQAFLSLMNKGFWLSEESLDRASDSKKIIKEFRRKNNKNYHLSKRLETKKTRKTIRTVLICLILLSIFGHFTFGADIRRARRIEAQKEQMIMERNAEEKALLEYKSTLIGSPEDALLHVEEMRSIADAYFEEDDISTYLLDEYERKTGTTQYSYKVLGYYFVQRKATKLDATNNRFGIVYEQSVSKPDHNYGPIYKVYEFDNLRIENESFTYDIVGACDKANFSNSLSRTSVGYYYNSKMVGHALVFPISDDGTNTCIFEKHIDVKLSGGGTKYWMSDDLIAHQGDWRD